MKFCHEIDKIFVHKDIEKDPLKETATFKVLNILDPEDLLTDDEEKIVVQCLNRIGWQVQEKRLLLKPQFKDKVIFFFSLFISPIGYYQKWLRKGY